MNAATPAETSAGLKGFRSIKCSKSTDDPLRRCKNCADFDIPCTFNRPTRRRGTKTKPISGVDQPGYLTHSGSAAGDAELGVTNTNNGAPSRLDHDLWSVTAHNNESGIQGSWKAFAIASEPTIMNLVQAYFEIVYPMSECPVDDRYQHRN
ncbi:hypothetical protein PHISCL_08764 [Aspergillus sclerotialis]|uniref:Zn(2)-C6 fungal-type domain-containing protein n=1 Tax=Aspergillus sclerotialis TaxID=2070753 RepID=A0A3A2ZC69_9EURO|nr:hypothetical protein PHISCL_08764 [Aspergillus sclerotialis]